jgi:voltage-gated potassium channel
LPEKPGIRAEGIASDTLHSGQPPGEEAWPSDCPKREEDLKRDGRAADNTAGVVGHLTPGDTRRSVERPVSHAVRAVLLLVLFGTCGYMWIEGWDFTQSLYFTIITVTTVGYSDYGLSEHGLRFTTILIVSGIGVVTYSVGQLAPIVLNQRLVREWKMNRQIKKLTDHFIVCGLGRVGRAVCHSLDQQGISFVAVDPDEAAVDQAVAKGCVVITGDAAADETLIQAGVKNARGVTCVTGSDTDNIVITLSARQLNSDLFIISRAEDPTTIHKMYRAGASRVISPILAGGSGIANAMIKPHLAELLEEAHDADSGITLAEVPIGEASQFAGRTIRDCGSAHESVVFVALKLAEGGTRLRPAADKSLQGGDVLIVAGEVLAVGRLQQEARRLKEAA